ncbi:MAG TPA: hypothetical protein VES62_05340 [Thermoleophilaceae bacterium]|nr:hypothetical protein [Thermoleophilaceae bacterium]
MIGKVGIAVALRPELIPLLGRLVALARRFVAQLFDLKPLTRRARARIRVDAMLAIPIGRRLIVV